MTKTFEVTVPFAGSFTAVLEAESEQEALSRAMECAVKMEPDDFEGEINDVEYLDKIVSGNVCHAPVNERYVEEIES